MSSVFHVGALNHRIEFLEKRNIKDGYGEVSPQLVHIHSSWASLRTQYIKEVMANIGTVLEDTVTFIIRYDQRVEIKNNFIVQCNNDDYEIIKINNGASSKDYTTIICKKVS